MTESVSASKSTAVGKQKRHCGSRLFTRRRADVRPEIGYRVGVLGLFDRAVFADAHQRLALVGQLLHAMVLPVGDVDVAVLVEGDPPRLVELARAVAGPAAFADELAVGGEDLQPIVAAVDDDEVAVLLDRQTGRTRQLAVPAPRFPKFAQELAAAVEYRDRVLPF